MAPVPLSRTGFWGPRTASVDWCEPNYVYTQYVAEFWNTLTSVPIALAGLFGIIMAIKYKYRLRFFMPSMLMMFVGLGSIGFHGTLSYIGQAIDELNMVYAVSAFLFTVLELDSTVKKKWLPAALVLYNVCFTATYVFLPRYFEFFVLTFIAGCVWLFLQSFSVYRRTHDYRLRQLFVVGFGLYAASFLFLWIPDALACSSVGALHLHAWFHICSGIGPWWYISYITHFFYVRRFARATGLYVAADGSFVPAPANLIRDEDEIAAAAAGLAVADDGSKPAAAGKAGAAPAPGAADYDPEAGVVIVPEIRWVGPSFLIMWPWVHLTRKHAAE